jgi:hypothetical protein
MKKFLVSLVMLVVTTLGAHAQFEKDVWYVNASLTGLDLSHSKYEGTNFGFTLGGGAFVADNFAVLLNFKGQYVEHGTDETSIGAQGRYYLSSCGVYGGLGMAYKHLSSGDYKKNLVCLTPEVGYAFFLGRNLTVKENFGKLEGLTLVYCGDGRNNVANSLLVTGAILGVNVHIFSPKELFPDETVVTLAEGFAKESGARVLITDNADEAVKGADVLYTDVWVSMGEESKFEERVKLLKPYQVNMDLVKKAENENLIFLHCLPAFHDTNTVYGKDVAEKFGLEEMEVTDEVFRSKYARHFDQAENRMHTIKAVMAATLGDPFVPRV